MAIGPGGNLYAVGSNELAVIDPNDGSTIRSVPFLFINGCTPALTSGVVWVYSDTQTYAYDSDTLELLRVFDGSPRVPFWFRPGGGVRPRYSRAQHPHPRGICLPKSTLIGNAVIACGPV